MPYGLPDSAARPAAAAYLGSSGYQPGAEGGLFFSCGEGRVSERRCHRRRPKPLLRPPAPTARAWPAERLNRGPSAGGTGGRTAGRRVGVAAGHGLGACVCEVSLLWRHERRGRLGQWVLARAAAECDGEGNGLGARGRVQNSGAQGARMAGGEGDLEGARPAGDGGAMG